jgi:hypothetical protein
MAEHNVKFRVPWRSLGRVNIEFAIRADGVVLGHLYLSKGTVAWRRAEGKVAHELSWSDFAKLMESDRQRRGR